MRLPAVFPGLDEPDTLSLVPDAVVLPTALLAIRLCFGICRWLGLRRGDDEIAKSSSFSAVPEEDVTVRPVEDTRG